MKKALFNIILYVHLIIEKTSGNDVNDEAHLNETDAEDEKMINQYKMYLKYHERLLKLDAYGLEVENNNMDDDTEAFIKFKIEAANWHLKALTLELLEKASQIAKNNQKISKNEKDGQSQLNEALKKNVEELAKRMSMETIEKLVKMHGEVETKCAKMKDDIIGKIFKLYDRYNFVVRIVVIVDKWTTDKRAWSNIGHEKRITELFEVSYPFSQLDEEELSNSEEVAFLDTSVAFVGNKYKLRIIHAENVKKMVKESPVFRDFLCKNSDDFETNIKPSLEQMVGSSELIRLEDQFPEALRIDIMSQQTLLEIYRQILSPATNEEAIDDGKYGSKKMLARKMMAMTVQIMRENESQFKKQNPKNGNLKEIFGRKMKAILAKAFDNLFSAKSLCEMVKFISLTREKRAQKQLETELKKWEMNKCETEQEQKQTMYEFRQKELNSRFKQDILVLLEAGGEQKTKMGEILAKDGAKSGLVELIEWKQYKELDDGGYLLGIFPSNSFQNDERLFKHYKEAITHKKSSVVSVKNKMSADIIVFLRFLHVYIMAELNLQILWHKMHKLFELEYDRLFREEDNLVKFLKIERQLEEMIMETSDFLKKEIKEKQLKNATKFVDENLRNKWEKKMDKCQGKSGPNLAKGSRYSEKEQLMEKLHLREMLNLLKQKNSNMKLEEILLSKNPEGIKLFVDVEELYAQWKKFFEIDNIKMGIHLLKNGEGTTNNWMEMLENITNQNDNSYGCPKKSKKPEELAAIDKANQVEEEMIMNFFEYFKLENDQRESADNEKECHSIEMDTLAWHFKYQIKSLKGTSNWKKIEEIFSDKNREIKLCRIYTHFEYVTKREKGILYAGFVDEQMLSAQNDEQFFEWLNRKCSTDDRLFVANAIHTVCSNRLQVREANFMAFRHLLLSSQQFRAYFCKLANSSQNNYVENKIYDAEIWCDDGWTKVCFEVQKIGEVKEKILALIGDEKMLLLEAQFPEVLKIDAIMLQTQPFLYKNILAHKSHTDETKFWSARLGIAHLVQMVNAMLSNFGLSVSFEFDIKYGFTVKSRDIFCEAFKHLTQQKFHGGIGRTLCALVQFKNYAQTFYEVFSAANDRLNLEAIAKWRPKCAENEEQDKAYQQMTKSLATQNGTMLKNLIIGNDEFKKFVQNTRGARARIGKLLVSAEEHQKFLEFCGEGIRNEKVFTDQWLMELYLEFLNKFAIMDTETQMRYFLSLSYSVWVRWMDRQIDPKNANLPIGLRQIYEQIWKNQRIQYEQIAYDKIFDVNFEELCFEFALILKVFEPLKKFVETKRNEKNLRKFGIEITKRNDDKNSPQKQYKEHIEKSEKLLEQWEAIWTNAKQNIRIWKTTECQTTECHTTQCQEGKLKMARPTEWLQTLHFDTLMDFLENKAMQSQLKNSLKKRREILKKWLMQFMDKEIVEKIQLAIQLNNEQIGEMRKKQKEKKEISEEKQKIYEEHLGNLEKELAEEEEKEQKKKEEKMAKEKEQKEKEKEKVAKDKEKKEEKMAKEKEQKEKEKEEVAKEKEQKEKMKIKQQKRKAKKEEEEKQKKSEKSSEVTKSSGNLGKSAETIGKERGKNERDANSIEIGDEAEGDELEDVMANIGLKDFLQENYLMTKYDEFLEEPNELQRKILDIGIYFYEISNRISAAEGIKKAIFMLKKSEIEFNYNRENEFNNLKQKWEKILQKNAIKTTKLSRIEYQNMKNNLQKLLKKIILATEGIESAKIAEIKTDKTKEKTEFKNTKFQMHRNNLANAIITRNEMGKSGQNWAKWDDERRYNALILLFEKDTQKRTICSNLVAQFGTHLEGWRKMREQQRIDQISINEHVNYTNSKMSCSNGGTEQIKMTNSHSFMLPQLNQQIFFNDNNDEEHLKELERILIEEHFVLTMDPTKALNELKAVVSNWSQGEAKLLEIGSLMLGTNTATSDVDIIYIVPQKTTKSEAMDKFFGTFQCDLSPRKCEDNSLYCLLCLNEKVEFLQKLPKAYIPLIKIHFLGFDFDILFVSVPTINALPAGEPMAQNEVMELIRKLANQTEPDEKMIKSLAGHITNDHIKRLLGKKMLKKFRKLVVILKFWAKSNFIYGTPFGFFNGISLSVMAAKVSLLYPNCSVPFLLNRFFLTFATWDWPIPLRLVEHLPNEFQKFSWTPKDEKNKRNSTLLMPIITPGCLEQNGMFHMNESTFKIVQKSMREAFIKLRQIQFPNENNWSQLFSPSKFTKKYKHYAAICCVVGNLIHLAQFCDFVERNIRFQLLHFDTVTDGVNFTHIMTENDGEFKCPNSILMPVLKQNRNFSLHKAWLVGIEMEEKTAEQKQNLPSEKEEGQRDRMISHLNLKFNEQFNEKIVQKYFESLKGCFQRVSLVSKYVDEKELENQ